jgi:hypothetical protein
MVMTDSSETLDWAGGAGALGATMGGGRTALVEGTDWSCVSRVIIGMSGAVKRVLTAPMSIEGAAAGADWIGWLAVNG